MKNINEIASKIEELISKFRTGELARTEYFNVYDESGEVIKIRVSNHSANGSNNGGKTLSFVTEKSEQRKSRYNKMIGEWEIDEDGYTDTQQSISEILEWEEIANDQEEAKLK